MKRIVPSALLSGSAALLMFACSSSSPPITSDGDDDASAGGGDATTSAPDAGSASPDAASATDAASNGDDGSTEDSDGAADSDASGASDASIGDDAAIDSGATTPKSVTITGTYTVNCTEEAGNTELDCNLVVSALTSTPPPPAGMTVAQAVTIMNENNEAPDMGYRGGLSVSTPAYPDSCEQVLQWFGSPSVGLAFSISSNTQSGQSCGLTTAPSANDFSSGFDASVIGVWTATHATVPVTLTLTKS